MHIVMNRPPLIADTSYQNSLKQNLYSASYNTASISAWQQLKELFARMNVASPASSAVERLCSCAGLVMAYQAHRHP